MSTNPEQLLLMVAGGIGGIAAVRTTLRRPSCNDPHRRAFTLGERLLTAPSTSAGSPRS